MSNEFSGIHESVRNEIVSVGTSSVKICEARNKLNERKNLIIQNTSSDDTMVITVKIGYGLAVADEGIVLGRGESFSDSSESGYKCTQNSVTAICEVAGGQLSVMER